MIKLTKPQITALKNVYDREWDKPNSYLTFRRTASVTFADCLMVPYCGMWLGIETDGYTHS